MPTEPYVDAFVARAMFRAGRAFRVRLEFYGNNDAVKRGYSDKWWELFYPGIAHTAVLCNHGATGARGRAEPFAYSAEKAWGKLGEKLAKGYRYVSSTLTSIPEDPKARPVLDPVHLAGPFAMIRRIETVGGGVFKAFDGNGDYLLDLDEEGKDQVLAADPYRVSLT